MELQGKRVGNHNQTWTKLKNAIGEGQHNRLLKKDGKAHEEETNVDYRQFLGLVDDGPILDGYQKL